LGISNARKRDTTAPAAKAMLRTLSQTDPIPWPRPQLDLPRRAAGY
jgi:hypothetical protein